MRMNKFDWMWDRGTKARKNKGGEEKEVKSE